jgi:hypothetical protein
VFEIPFGVWYFFIDGQLAAPQISTVTIWAGWTKVDRLTSFFVVSLSASRNNATTLSFHTLSGVLFTVTESFDAAYFEAITVSLNKLQRELLDKSVPRSPEVFAATEFNTVYVLGQRAASRCEISFRFQGRFQSLKL